LIKERNYNADESLDISALHSLVKKTDGVTPTPAKIMVPFHFVSG